MKYSKAKRILLVVLSGVLYGAALNFVQFYLVWICLVPFFLVLQACNIKDALQMGFIFGAVFSGVVLYWIPNAIFIISCSNTTATIFITLLIWLTVTFYFGLTSLCYAAIKSRKDKQLWISPFLMAGIWTLGIYLLSVIFPGMPWFCFEPGNALLDNLYAIQPASLGGIYLLSFVVVFVNYLFAHLIITKQWKMMVIPIGLILVYLTAGYGILFNFKQRIAQLGRAVTVTVVSSNIPKEQSWNHQTGNILAEKLLSLNKEALDTKPDIVLWPEGVVPWSYSSDDDFIKEITANNASQINAFHILGLKTVIDKDSSYNSAYCIANNGDILGRHDKRYLVALGERPVAFLSSFFLKETKGRNCFTRGQDNGVLSTPVCKTGVLICSELFVPQATQQCIENGAEILVSLSDDALFSSATGIVKQQFYKNRLRAVESRKDIAISCNMGISGMISATGDIRISNHNKKDGFAEKTILYPNHFNSIYHTSSASALYASAFVIIFSVLLNIKNQRTI